MADIEQKEKESEKEVSFDDAFDQAASETEGKETTETVEDKEATETSTKKEEVDERAEKVEKKPEEKVEKVDFEHKYSTLQGMFEKLSKDFEDYKKEKEEKKEKEPDKPKEVTPEPEKVDEELDSYVKEYDLIARNQNKLTEKALKKALNDFKEEIKKEISEKYDLSVKKVDTLLETKLEEDYQEHLGGIYDAHEDYGKTFQKADVSKWIETLSGNKKKLYEVILEDGTTEEVVDLISEFKEAKGIKPVEKSKEQEDLDIKEKEKIEKDKQEKLEKEKKLKEMEAVDGGKKSAIGGAIHKAEDYESAFDEAAAKEEKKK